jgi:hypothetical protein
MLFHMCTKHSGSFSSTIDAEQKPYLFFVSGVCDGTQIVTQACEGQALSLVKCRSALFEFQLYSACIFRND